MTTTPVPMPAMLWKKSPSRMRMRFSECRREVSRAVRSALTASRSWRYLRAALYQRRCSKYSSSHALLRRSTCSSRALLRALTRRSVTCESGGHWSSSTRRAERALSLIASRIGLRGVIVVHRSSSPASWASSATRRASSAHWPGSRPAHRDRSAVLAPTELPGVWAGIGAGESSAAETMGAHRRADTRRYLPCSVVWVTNIPGSPSLPAWPDRTFGVTLA